MGSDTEYLLGASTVRRHVPLVTFPTELVRLRTLKRGHVVHWAIDEDEDVVLISRDRDWFRSGLFREGRFTEFTPTRMTERGASAIPIGDLAEYIAIKEEEPSYERYERVLTDLAHSHLPHLHATGLIHYDGEEETVELAVKQSVVTPYLELAGYANA